jgi:peptide/nickel transport system permease protein
VTPRTAYLLRRLAFLALLVFLVSSASMLLSRLAPGDTTVEAIGQGATTADIQRERERLGLTQGLGSSYAKWLSRALRLDFGESFRYGRPVLPLVAERAANTALLGIVALLLATLAGIPLGIVAAGRRGVLGRLLLVLSTVALSLPPLVLSIAFAWMAARTGWLPVGGMTTAGLDGAGAGARAADLARHLVVPSLALAIPLAATLERLQSRTMTRALGAPWIQAARARGIPARRLRWVHAASVAAGPVIAVYGLLAGSVLSGSFAVEIVTAWPGLGRLMYEALLARDVNLVAGCAAATATCVAAGTLLADAALAWIDPRTVEAP